MEWIENHKKLSSNEQKRGRKSEFRCAESSTSVNAAAYLPEIRLEIFFALHRGNFPTTNSWSVLPPWNAITGLDRHQLTQITRFRLQIEKEKLLDDPSNNLDSHSQPSILVPQELRAKFSHTRFYEVSVGGCTNLHIWTDWGMKSENKGAEFWQKFQFMDKLL